MPLQRRLPKRGFHNLFRTGFVVVNVGSLNRFDEGTEVTPERLIDAGLVSKKNQPIKVLGTGTLEKKLGVKLHAASVQARKKIEAAGGSFEVLEQVAPRPSGKPLERTILSGTVSWPTKASPTDCTPKRHRFWRMNLPGAASHTFPSWPELTIRSSCPSGSRPKKKKATWFISPRE